MNADRRYRIAVVAACPFPSLRGSQVLVRELADGLAHAGHACTSSPIRRPAPGAGRAHRDPPRAQAARAVDGASFGSAEDSCSICCSPGRCGRVVRQERIDVVHAHNLEAPLLAFAVRWLTGVPVVYHATTPSPTSCRATSAAPGAPPGAPPRCGARRLAGARRRRLSSRSPIASALPGGARRRRPGARDSTRRAAPGGAGDPGTLRDAGPLVMYGGNLDPYQDLDCLLEGSIACAPSSRARGSCWSRIAARIRAPRGAPSGWRASRGSWSRKRRRLLLACGGSHRPTCLVCPRGSWSGFPIKVLNYMALGRPIVHARASAHAIDDGVTGLVVDDGDSGALARAMLRVVRDPALGAHLGRQARTVARERFALTRVLNNVVEVYEQVVVGGGDGRQRPARPGRQMELGMKEQMQRLAEARPRRSDGLSRSAVTLASALLLAAVVAGCAPKTVEAPLPPVSEPLSPSLVDTGQYRLEPGDILRVKFIYQPEMDVKLEIDPDGNISIPGVGEVQARGKTAEELARDVETLSSTNLRDPEVTVIVAQLGPRKVFVTGEVRLPGPVLYRVGMTPMQAIIDRGGFTEVARIDSVLHVTNNGNTVEATRLDFSGEIKEGSPELQALAVNDQIVVPRTFIGDANAFVRLYIRGLMPTMPRLGVGLNP
jgi:protein involved in polysaccharide export with SLBB domain/glycosyltransferase involved in cell wall biosynthesis